MKNQAIVGVFVAYTAIKNIAFKPMLLFNHYRYGVDAVTLLMYRMLFSLPFFAIMAWWASRGKAALTKHDWFGILGLGFTGYYLASYLDFAGLAYITASLERLILYINPTLVLIMAWLLYKKPISARQIAAMALSYSGILLVFGHELVMQEFGAGVGAANTIWGCSWC
ncbi:MAG: DMT family transporter, partial [Polaromonas sp.]|nr:DMT family transporter [Polaromonas sp.]